MPTNTPTPTPTPCPSPTPIPVVNVLTNGDFENGTTNWGLSTDGQGSLVYTTSVAYGGSGKSGKVNITSAETSTDLYQSGFNLKPNIKYRISFAAYSSSGDDLKVSVSTNGDSVSTNLGLSQVVSLGTSWGFYSYDFTTTNFTSSSADTRLKFWLSPYAVTGDSYFFDNVMLYKL